MTIAFKGSHFELDVSLGPQICPSDRRSKMPERGLRPRFVLGFAVPQTRRDALSASPMSASKIIYRSWAILFDKTLKPALC
jgi:hypothetical protein